MTKPFLRTVAGALVLTAAAKLGSSLGTAAVLGQIDPVIGIPFGKLLIFAALIELVVAAVCIARPSNEGLFAVGWISGAFLIYRSALWWIGWTKPCACLGTVTDALHISPQLADNLMKGLLAFMLTGSMTLLIARWRAEVAAKASPSLPVVDP